MNRQNRSLKLPNVLLNTGYRRFCLQVEYFTKEQLLRAGGCDTCFLFFKRSFEPITDDPHFSLYSQNTKSTEIRAISIYSILQ